MLTVDDVSPGLLAVHLGHARQWVRRMTQVYADGHAIDAGLQRRLLVAEVEQVAETCARYRRFFAGPTRTSPRVQQQRAESLAQAFGVALEDVEWVEPSRW